ncbi:class I SAM-dependent methyltransferase [Roseobacter sinensis]|uniref:Methyltransferase domain-containing protein n=1 Tax=Roseobacter sinensis TaxID=2931391 RepID=A0ABT3BGE4_9RHOB|nr:methyltransferase domain-containing protein [Roseobacter sp. WL0113]MCV3272655.1 methyltransferase domain-containing protein [Roseobacter sp. WL0113]
MKTLEAEVAENRVRREANRKAAEQSASRGKSHMRRWAKWAIEPLNAAMHALRLARLKAERRKRIAEYLERDGFKGLQVGCGPHINSGWHNSDIFMPRPFFRGFTKQESELDLHVDITEPLPYPDDSLDAIYAEEVLEHVPNPAGRAFLSEAKRVLRPGGVLRLTTPDALGICKVFAGGVPDVDVEHWEPFWLNPYWSREYWLNGQFYLYGHQHLWTFEELSDALGQSGFKKVERVEPMQTNSEMPQLANLERHAVSNPEILRIDAHVRQIVEATA